MNCGTVLSRGQGASPKVHDADAAAEGFVVVYTRHEGSTPERDICDSLRTFDSASGAVTERYAVGGWEWSIGAVTAADGLIVFTEHQIESRTCVGFDTTTDTMRRPLTPVSPECSAVDAFGGCMEGCSISPDGRHLVGLDRAPSGIDDDKVSVVVWDRSDGTEVTRVIIDPEPGSTMRPLVSGSSLLVNRRTGDGTFISALRFDLTNAGAGPVELPMAGRASFVTEPIDVLAPLPAPERSVVLPAHYRYGDDGLYEQTVLFCRDDLGDGWLPIRSLADGRLVGVGGCSRCTGHRHPDRVHRSRR